MLQKYILSPCTMARGTTDGITKKAKVPKSESLFTYLDAQLHEKGGYEWICHQYVHSTTLLTTLVGHHPSV